MTVWPTVGLVRCFHSRYSRCITKVRGSPGLNVETEKSMNLVLTDISLEVLSQLRNTIRALLEMHADSSCSPKVHSLVESWVLEEKGELFLKISCIHKTGIKLRCIDEQPLSFLQLTLF